MNRDPKPIVSIASRYQYDPVQAQPCGMYKRCSCIDTKTKTELSLLIFPQSDQLIASFSKLNQECLLPIIDLVRQNDGSLAVITAKDQILNLKTLLDAHRHLDEKDALIILQSAAQGIQHLHERHIRYQRVCPENVVFCQGGHIRLGFLPLPQTEKHRQHCSPQQLQGKSPTNASDVFDLGQLLYRMIYGVWAFVGQTPEERLKMMKNKQFNEPKSGLFPVVVARETHYMLVSMLEYHQENRPTLASLLSHPMFMWPGDNEQEIALEGLSEKWKKKYQIILSSRTSVTYGGYYQEKSYLAIDRVNHVLVRVYSPQVKMAEATPNKIKAHYGNLRCLLNSVDAETLQNEHGDNQQQIRIKLFVGLCEIDRLGTEAAIVANYSNQGTLATYLDKRKVCQGWLSEPQINMTMHLLLLGLKQMLQRGLASIHTICAERIVIHDCLPRLREPCLLTPMLEKRLQSSRTVDWFAPQLKQNAVMIELDKSHVWSLGVLHYFLLAGTWPTLNLVGSHASVNLKELNADAETICQLEKCMALTVEFRCDLETMSVDNVDGESLLQFLSQEQHESLADAHSEAMNEEKSELQQQGLRVNYNKMLVKSPSSNCRVAVKILCGLALLWGLFFGVFIRNGAAALFKTEYLRPVTLQVQYNHGRSLRNITILTDNGSNLQQLYARYSYEQFITNLSCYTNQYSPAAQATVSDFINGNHSLFCFFGFILLILISVLYVVLNLRFDLPAVLLELRVTQINKKLVHYLVLCSQLPSILFCFFYLFALEYIMRRQPCLGALTDSYPQFTSVDRLLEGDMRGYFAQVLLTVGLWMAAMLLYCYLSIFIKKVNSVICTWQVLAGVALVMLVFTLVCRVGFGSCSPVEPTWSWKMNTDLVLGTYWGFFGFFPEILLIVLLLLERAIDLVFWLVVRSGNEARRNVANKGRGKFVLSGAENSGKEIKPHQENNKAGESPGIVGNNQKGDSDRRKKSERKQPFEDNQKQAKNDLKDNQKSKVDLFLAEFEMFE